MISGEQLLEELGRFDGDAEILRAWRDGMAPEPALLVSEWADRHRMLSSRGSAEPGPWRTARTPYLRDIMDALSALHPARRVVFMKGAPRWAHPWPSIRRYRRPKVGPGWARSPEREAA